MTEEEWLNYPGFYTMFEYVRGTLSDRKLRLFGCACCRRIAHLINDERSRRAIAVAERFADGTAEKTELQEAWSIANSVVHDSGTPDPNEPWIVRDGTPYHAALAASWAACVSIQAWEASTDATKAMRSAALRFGGANRDVVGAERHEQAKLLCHFVGNPFRPYPVLHPFPPAAVQLAIALYDGQDCGFALHDALIEARHADLAEHFSQEIRHPKGCWVLDLILGKE
jgi:hypothetical protein